MNTSDLIKHAATNNMSDAEVQAANALQNGATRMYNRTPGSNRKEYDPKLKTLIEDVEAAMTDDPTPVKADTVRKILVGQMANKDEGKKKEDNDID
jgi:hypothetical protein